MAREQRRYAAFLSYSHQDEKWASWVHRRLERYRVPKRLREAGTHNSIPARIRPVFRDREELPSAGNLGEKISEALENSAALVVICSPASARSHWVNEEIINFKGMHGEQSVFCLIVDGEPGAGDEQECFAPALRFQLDANGALGTEPAEPIAADARQGKDGRSLALLKLIAGLLNVGLDDLRQREQQRRNRRVLGIAIASLAGMALTGFLAINAMIARDDAQRRQLQAEGLVEFMLGDLKEELGKVGRLDALDATARKAVEYFAELPDREMDDDALARRAQAFRAIGEIHMDRREWDQALDINSLALADSAQLLERDRNNPERVFDLSQSQFWVGYVHLEAGNLAAAEAPFLAYLDLSERLVQLEPDNPDWVMELSYAHTNLAGLYRDMGQPYKAVASAARGVEFNRAAAALAGDDPFYQEELAGALAWLARAQLSAGDLANAAKTSTEARTLYAGMLETDQDNMRRREQLATSLRGEANAVHMLGQHELARTLLNESLGHMTTLTRFDPSNDLWAVWAQSTALELLQVYLDSNLKEVTHWETLSFHLLNLVNADFPEDPEMDSLRLLASTLAPNFASGRALDWQCPNCINTEAALTALDGLNNANPGSLELVMSLAKARLQLSITAHVQMANLPRIGMQKISASAEQLSEALGEEKDPEFLAVLTRLYFLLGDQSKAAPLVTLLDEAGYEVTAYQEECRSLALCQQ